MKREEAAKLKPGDLVMIRWKNASTIYKDLVYEVASPAELYGMWGHVTVKQPNFDMGFRMNIPTRQLKRYEDVLKEIKMNKNQIIKVLPTVLFISGVVGIFVSEVMAARDTLKAEDVLIEKDICRHKAIIYDEPDENGVYGEQINTPLKEYIPEVIKATWKCYIPTFVTTSLTLTALIASKRLTQKQILALSSAVAGAGSLVGKYRKAILDRANPEILSEIDREVASATMEEAKPPVIKTSHLLSTTSEDLSEETGEVLFFDPFTKMKFRSTKLAVLGAKYYLNRNFSLGSEAPLSMFYAFLGLDLPEEYSYAGWDVIDMEDNGYYWIDIDCVKSSNPDPDTGEYYYILEYDMLPGDTEDNYYPFGNPLTLEGSRAV